MTKSRGSQIPLPEPLAMHVEDKQARKMVYLITIPHPWRDVSVDGFRLVSPGTMSREAIRDAVLDACAHPVAADRGNRARVQPVAARYLCVFREYHKAAVDGSVFTHVHIGVLAFKDFMFMPMKRALLQRHGLAANFSCSHTGYHSVVGYCVLPTRNKPQAALDPKPLVWAAKGEHPDLFDAAQEPTTVAALQRRMERRSKAASELGKKARYCELNVWPLVVRNGIRNSDEGEEGYLRLIKVAKETCPHAFVDFLFKLRKKLPSLIDDVWSWEGR